MQQLTEQTLLFILKETQKMAETKVNITSKEIVQEIEKMLTLNGKSEIS